MTDLIDSFDPKDLRHLLPSATYARIPAPYRQYDTYVVSIASAYSNETRIFSVPNESCET